MHWKAIALQQMPSFSVGVRPSTRLPQAGFIDIKGLGTAMESELYSCCFDGVPVALLQYKHLQGLFIRKVKTIPKQLHIQERANKCDC